MVGSVRLALSYSAASETGSADMVRAAACNDGRSPKNTTVINSITM